MRFQALILALLSTVTLAVQPTAAQAQASTCVDADGDGFGVGDTSSCVDPTSDCDDTDPGAYPGAVEVCDGIDNDCDQLTDSEEGYPDYNGDDIPDCVDSPPVGTIIITEVMQNPGVVSDALGEWFEIHNTSSSAIDLDGWTFSDNPGPNQQSFEIASTLVIQPDEYLVFARNGDDSINGGVDVDYEYGGSMALNNGEDEILIYTSSSLLMDTVAWGNGLGFPAPNGASMALAPGLLDSLLNDDGNNWCESTNSPWWWWGNRDPSTPGSASNDLNSDSDGDGIVDCVDDDSDNDGDPDETDCDDANPNNFNGNDEVCDGFDNDCNGLADFNDLALGDDDDSAGDDDDSAGDDDDSAGDDDDSAAPEFYSVELDIDDDGFLECQGDCDDDNAAVSPSAPELCDGLDNDCDGIANADIDGEVDADGDMSLSCEDCDDNEPSAYPEAVELCDGIDNDCNGESDATGPFGPVVGSSTSGQPITGVILHTDTITLSGAGSIADVNVSINLNHEWDWDLIISLVSPAGTVIALSAQNGEDGDDYLDTVFDDEASIAIWDDEAGAVPPFTGSFIPEDPLSQLDGEDMAGDWTLQVNDTYPSADDGVLNYWSIEVNVGGEADSDADGFLACDDCDDANAAINPSAVEVCNGLDDDCDGVTPADEADSDSDGFRLCLDCDDNDSANFPGNTELCDGQDNDCDASTEAAGGEIDADVDSFLSCNECDDTNAAVNPSATEICNGLDDDCDGALLDAAGEVDVDMDTALSCEDCDDSDAVNYPGNSEVCDGQDNDCDSATYADAAMEVDVDQDGDLSCSDCDDNDAGNFTGNVEVCDGLDNDCNGLADFNEVPMGDDDDDDDSAGDDDDSAAGDDDDSAAGDDDDSAARGDDDDSAGDDDDSAGDDDDSAAGDDDDSAAGDDDDSAGDMIPDFDSMELDLDGDGYLECQDDCNDLSVDFAPDAPELCDGEDNDCDSVLPEDEWDVDSDGQKPCEGDCDDDASTTYLEAPELCDAIDNDCDGTIEDEEIDGDLDGFAPCDDDCDDTDSVSYPGAEELCDGVDNACSGAVPDDENDADGDGFYACSGDCDDTNAGASPEQVENTEALCTDGFDNDCNELTDLDDEACLPFEPSDDDELMGTGPECACSSSQTPEVSTSVGYALMLLGLVGFRRRRA